MARTYVFDHKHQTRIPYLRGILTRSLQKAGLTFEKAHTLASSLRDDIADLDEITTIELRKRVIRILDEQKEISACQRYQASRSPDQMLLVRSLENQTAPFSRGVHQHALELLGIPGQRAREITTRLYHEIQAQGVAEISSQQLGHLTYRALLGNFDEDTARHYLVWSAFRRSGRPLIVLIGGVPGCGKSTVSVELANRMEIVRTQSTDMLREVMRMMMPERLAPVLHTSSFNAWEALPESDSNSGPDMHKLIAQGYSAQSELLSVPCEAVVRRALRENVSLILEGVHIKPTLLKQLPTNDAAIAVPVMLAVMNPENLRKRIRTREGLVPQRQAERYLNHFDGIWYLQSLLLSEADQESVPIVNSTDREAAVQSVTRIIIEVLEQEFEVDVESVFGPMES